MLPLTSASGQQAPLNIFFLDETEPDQNQNITREFIWKAGEGCRLRVGSWTKLRLSISSSIHPFVDEATAIWQYTVECNRESWAHLRNLLHTQTKSMYLMLKLSGTLMLNFFFFMNSRTKSLIARIPFFQHCT